MKYIIITEKDFNKCCENGFVNPQHMWLKIHVFEMYVNGLEDWFCFKTDQSICCGEYILLRIDFPFEYTPNECSNNFFEWALDNNGETVVRYYVMDRFVKQ